MRKCSICGKAGHSKNNSKFHNVSIKKEKSPDSFIEKLTIEDKTIEEEELRKCL